jgi:acyl CoA:acetate/3-ketoacid CoA transferase alpha subunit
VSTGIIEALRSGAANMGAGFTLIDIGTSLASALITLVASTSEAAVSVGAKGIDIAIIGADVALINVGTLTFVTTGDCFISGFAAAREINTVNRWDLVCTC